MVGGQPYSITTGQSLNLKNTPAIEHELMVQCQIYDQQLLSPTQRNQHKRQDSLFPISPSSGTMSSGPSPQQAEAQPCLPVTHMSQETQMSRPADMMRSTSHRSQQSTGSYQQGIYGRHRSSFGQGSEIGTVEMSRSSTQQSRTSTGIQHLQTAPQFYAARAHPSPIGHGTWNTNYTTPTTSATYSNYDPVSNTAVLANSMYNFGSNTAHFVNAAELDGMGNIFAQGSDTNDVFGQDAPLNK
jgi:hypothetical protein